MITTGDYAPRCRNIGIECWDGRDFQKQERKWIWIRRLKLGITQGLIIAGIAVLANSAWDKDYELHDTADKTRKLIVKSGTQIYQTAKELYDKYSK